MSAAPNPLLKSLPVAPDGPGPAGPARTAHGEGATKDVGRKAVPSALRPDPRPYVVAVLHIIAPASGSTPTATSRCACGRDRSAIGKRRVLALIADHTAHRDLCPLHTPQEGRRAA
ncbi:hypothetical protein [Streptomyces sp. NPDC060194]|uniref:hypothetical protein n=1 Tax=Streptomyces sp. NPDC060194 TaxID=3347069 RepID=UPI0036460D31